jgi:8-oxo-dGTP pyrophosphatase MutT (NUDIX family)
LSPGEDGFLEKLSGRLARLPPARPIPGESASVAVIFLGEGSDEKILLITRAEREGDPWSGDVAFPGGMVDADDQSFEETAKRETLEEVGIDLVKERAMFLGYMRRFNARTRELTVVPSVFSLIARSEVTLSKEAALYEWVPVQSLASSDARSTYLLRTGTVEIPFPALVYRRLTIWGLTERIISSIIGDET